MSLESSKRRGSGTTKVLATAPSLPESMLVVFNPLDASKGFDWYGNNRLHSLVGSVEYSSPNCVHMVQRLIEEYPQSVSLANQFGRLPLHYALDRLSGKLNLDVIKVLIMSFPGGVTVRDHDERDSLDLCRYWNHPKQIRMLVANAAPVEFARERDELQYGETIALLLETARALKSYIRLSPVFGGRSGNTEGEDEDEDEDEDKSGGRGRGEGGGDDATPLVDTTTLADTCDSLAPDSSTDADVTIVRRLGTFQWSSDSTLPLES